MLEFLINNIYVAIRDQVLSLEIMSSNNLLKFQWAQIVNLY